MKELARFLVVAVFSCLSVAPLWASSTESWEENQLVGFTQEKGADVFWFQSCSQENDGCHCMEEDSDLGSDVICLSKLIIGPDGKTQWLPGVETNVSKKRIKELRKITKMIDLGEIWGDGERALEYKSHFRITLKNPDKWSKTRKVKLDLDVEGPSNTEFKKLFFRVNLTKKFDEKYFHGMTGYFLPDGNYVVLHPLYVCQQGAEGEGESTNWWSYGVLVFKLENP